VSPLFEEFAIRITFNAGIALNETEEHLKKASLALTYSRNYGPGQHAIFSQYTVARDRYEENISWGKIVKKAIAGNGLIPYFQGIYSNSSGGIEKYECLVRIQDGSDLYLPRQFLPAAARLGLMTSVTREMLSCCFAYFAALPREMEFSLNISEEDLLDVDFLNYVERSLFRHEIRPGRVIFEIIETASIADKRALRNLDGLKKAGCQLALDDFGTENSNFARILSLKADFIKIDGRFVSEMHRSRDSFIVVKTVTDFAHSIGAKAVAEFVHCPEIQSQLIEIGADYSQGYLIHRPSAGISA
jgi:EAL domain-containing protein (putative c-di-GMP-specific phosphodiesterase class I)